MTRALALPARQVTALCRGAAKAGHIAEVKIGDVVVRLMSISPVPTADEAEAAYRAARYIPEEFYSRSKERF